MGSVLRASVRLFLYLGWTLLLVPVQAAVLALKARAAVTLPVFYHRVCLRIIGIQEVTRGTMASEGPVLFVANHSSYLDITVLGAIIPGSFVSKAEVAAWPLFGILAKLQRTVFVDRAARRKIAHQKSEIMQRLTAGDMLILFPEGTSDNGIHVLPFKSALLSAAEEEIAGRYPTVQPVSIAYTKLDGIPMGRAIRPFYAWYGDMAMFPHLWRVLGLGLATVEVEFHPPVTIAAFGSRKELAEYCRRQISAGILAAVSGRAGAAKQPETEGKSGESGIPAAAGRP
jgi:lyso-ornithine lipid O-acyltransferase